jgi:cytoplasmic iron level regulating protein YaaA (DUF328/UPF0246 family)
VLVILPPSETKRSPPDAGPPLDVDRLSFPSLREMRLQVLEALIATSCESDALRRLLVRQPLAGEVARNLRLRDLPTRRAAETYSGPLYQGLDAPRWPDESWQRADRHLVIVSSLWGALRPGDMIPAYRLHVCARLVGMDRLEPAWRSVLPAVLDEAAESQGPILDLRSPVYQALGRPPRLDDETVTLRIRPAQTGPAHIGDVIAKRMRGEAARQLLAHGTEAEDPLDIADALAMRFPIEVDSPGARSRSWTITLEAPPSSAA